MVTDGVRSKQAMRLNTARKQAHDMGRKSREHNKRARLKAAAYNGATERELRYMRQCKRKGEVPRLGRAGAGGSWGL